MEELKQTVEQLDSILEIFIYIQDKAEKEAKESDNPEFRNLVNQYQLVKDRLVNVELQSLHELAKG